MFLKSFRFEKTRKLILVMFDLVCFALVSGFYFLTAIFIDRQFTYSKELLIHTVLLLVFVVLARVMLEIYAHVWRYFNLSAYTRIILSDALGGLAALVVIVAVSAFHPTFYKGIWHTVTIAALDALVVLMSRFVYHYIYRHIKRSLDTEKHKIPVAIVGAGQVGVFLAEELMYSKRSNYKPIFFIDHDPAKVGGRIAGLRVYPEDDRLIEFIQTQEVSEIFIALPRLSSEEATRLYEYYSQTKCKVKLYESPLLAVKERGQKAHGKLREFQIEDLLFRKSLQINHAESIRYYAGKVVLVTGGGGSIGSEICRQIAKCHPERLIVVDIYENNAYEIQQELLRAYGGALDLVVEIASVRDRERMNAIFKAYRPNIVFHAAAHKHVPLMEHSGCEAVKNNVLGTYNTADAAEKYGVERFILISTDKAVNPTNVMGASKRMCEMIVQSRVDSKTAFAAVRFGNVLGSNGSVIPLFKRQIENGGPVTITDKRIVRYFMTIPEASQLVIEAGAMAQKGELFVLDMGKPVRIYELAKNMIRLSGLEPDVDIQIKEVGLRPGEKLYEELLIKTELLTKTENDMIFIEKDTPMTREEVDAKIKLLTDAVQASRGDLNSDKVIAALRRAVPTFYDPNVVNRAAEESEEMKDACRETGATV